MGEKLNSLRVITIILIILLFALFVYVEEDIPVFGDPYNPTIKYVEILSVENNKDDKLLDQNIIPETITSNLLKRGFPSPIRIEKINGLEGQWNGFIIKEEPYYSKEEKYYFMKKEGDLLKIYRYAFVARWIEKGLKETSIPNMVTYGLADYRGYDTLGETTVIFTAGVSVILLLRRRSRL